MKIEFLSTLAVIAPDPPASRKLYAEALGLPLEGGAGEEEYQHSEQIHGCKHFGVWPLSQAAEACFGTEAWPADLPEPQAWMELDVDSPDDVAPATAEMAGRGYRILVDSKLEPWGQTVSHLLSPEGILVGIVYTPWMHEKA